MFNFGLNKILNPQKNILIIEMTDSHLKIVFLKAIRENKEFIDAAVYKIEDYSDEEIVDKIKEFMHTHSLKNPVVINVMPSNFVIAKNIEIPSVDDKEINEIIELQASRHTPYSRNEIIMDYMKVGVVYGRYTQVILIIVKRVAVDRRLKIIGDAGLNVDTCVLDAEALSLFCIDRYIHELEEGVLGVVDIDYNHTIFAVINKQSVLYIRTILIGSKDILSQESGKNKLLDELKNSLEAYQAENIGDFPKKALLTRDDEFQDIRTGLENLNISCVALSCPEFTDDNSKLSSLVREEDVSLFASLSTAYIFEGLHLNLIPEEDKLKKKILRKARETTKLGILSIVTLFLLSGFLISNIILKNMYITRLIEKYGRENKEAQQLQNILDRIGIIKRFLREKGKSLEVLSKIFGIIPKDIYLNSLTVDKEGKISITGTANSMSKVFSFVTEIEESEYFKDVNVDFTKTRRVKGEEVADFGFTFYLEG